MKPFVFEGQGVLMRDVGSWSWGHWLKGDQAIRLDFDPSEFKSWHDSD
jgi:hypothetical protein